MITPPNSWLMLRPIDNYFIQKSEPAKSCLQFLREHILGLDSQITESWKYGMPFFNYNGKRFCYLWIHKKHNLPYIGFVEGNSLHHPELLAEKRTRMKILLIDAEQNIDIKKVDTILKEAIELAKR